MHGSIMPDLAFDLRYLRCAALAAECGSFRRAAEALGISQSTLSRRVLLLERRLGVALFDRTPSGVYPTPAGKQFIRDAAYGADHLRQAVSRLKGLRKGHGGELRVGVMTSIAGGFLAELFCSFRKNFPDVSIRLEEASAQSNAAGVLGGKLDVAFIPGTSELPGCESRELWRERIYLALPAGHALANCQNVRWEDVRDETFLVHADGSGREVEDYLIRQLSTLGFRPQIASQKVGRENLLNMVAQGFGITIATFSALATSYVGVKFVPAGDGAEYIRSSAIWATGSSNPSLKKLLELCGELSVKYEKLGV